MSDVLDSPREAIGGNLPPEPTPFEAVRDRIADLFLEATNWADGAAVANQAQADEISFLIEQLRKAKGAADEQRKAEAKPFDDGKAEVQARYNPLIKDGTGKADLAISACKAALKPWLQQLEDEQKAVAAAARRVADELAAKAAAARASADASNLVDVAQAEELTQDAAGAAHDAKWASRRAAHARGGKRAISLRSYFEPKLTDGVAAARHYWLTRRADCEAFFLELARGDVAAGKRTLPGFDVVEDRRPV